MDLLLASLAESSPVAVVALFALWRYSVVMVSLADALVLISKQKADMPPEIMTLAQRFSGLPATTQSTE